MNLYSTVKSERAEKSQGGNDYISATITLEKEEVVNVILRKVENKTSDYYLHITKQGADLYRGVIKSRSFAPELKRALGYLPKKGENQKTS